MEKFRSWFRKLPNKKVYLELIAALLTIPVLLSVIALNYNNLKNKEEKKTDKPQEKIIITTPENRQTASPTFSSCKKEVGPLTITSPKEDETVTSNPVCFVINYSDSNYCSVVWSYRINNGNWSDYNSNAPCLYNPPQGDIKFELRVQSTTSADQEVFERNFTYKGSSNAPTPASSSAKTQ